MLVADAIKDVGAEVAPGQSVAVFGQVGEGHAVVGQHGVDGVRKRCNHAAEELRAVHLPGVIPEFDVGELGDTVDGQT